jgi:hypothetical protein
MTFFGRFGEPGRVTEFQEFAVTDLTSPGTLVETAAGYGALNRFPRCSRRLHQ